MALSEERRERLINSIVKDTFSDVNGFEITDLTEGFAAIEMDILPEHLNIWGIVHGGMLFALADTAAGFAADSARDAHMVTADGNVHFLFSRPYIKRIRAEGRVIKCGKTLIICQSDVYDEKGNHMLTGQFTMFAS